jgi:PEP-CTERM motif
LPTFSSKRAFRSTLLVPLAALLVASTPVGAATLDFEGFPDLTTLTNQYAGVEFLNATVISTSLDDAEFPPHSGVSVVFDDGGPISIIFSQPVAMVGGYFTYATQLTFVAFNGSSPVDSTQSAFNNNEAISGDPGSVPNENLTVSNPGGITEVTITGDPAGTSFVLDDLSYQPAELSSTPEPGTLLLILPGLGLIFSLFRVRKADRQC